MKLTSFRIAGICALLMFSFVSRTTAQNYKINFTATGAVTTLDSVKVENITQGTSLTLSGSDTLYLVNTIGFGEFGTSQEEMIVYPNPMAGQAEISFISTNTGVAELSIYDLSGKMVLSKNDYLFQGNQKYRITGLKKGLYYIHVKGNSYSVSAKLISLGDVQSQVKLEGAASGNNAVNNQSMRLQSMISMAFLSGDSLRYTGYSGIYNTSTADVPNGDKTIQFIFTFLPTLTTSAISSITDISAISGGDISSDGGAPVTVRGVCWSTSANPVSTGSHTTDGSGTGIFISNITGLTATTTYYVRAYATNSAGTAYGNEISFVTAAPATIPVITTTAVSTITPTTAISGGNITSDGGAPVTARGVCWDTIANPVSTGNHTTDGTGTGTFTSNISGLTSNTTYYVRAYATNSAGTAYGNEVNFTTSTAPLAIGDSHQGGIVAYILQPGDPGYVAGQVHGIIAAPTDQSAGIQWYNGTWGATNAQYTALGTGNANTNTIVSVQGNGNYAAKLCYDLVLNNYSDWYLPSKDELNKLYLNKAAIGGFFSAYYWSSTESDNFSYSLYFAHRQHFGTGVQSETDKNNTYCVRAVRSF